MSFFSILFEKDVSFFLQLVPMQELGMNTKQENFEKVKICAKFSRVPPVCPCGTAKRNSKATMSDIVIIKL